MIEFEVNSIVLSTAPIIIGLVQLLKGFNIDSKWIPLVALALGVTSGILFAGVNVIGIVSGIVASLSAMGLYSGVKTSLNNKQNP